VPIEQVFRNLAAVAKAAGGSLADVVKLKRVSHRPEELPAGERDHGAPFPGAVPGARRDRGGGAAARWQVEMDAVMVLQTGQGKSPPRGAEAQRKARVKKRSASGVRELSAFTAGT